MAEYNGKTGVWRTIGGRKVFIADGQSLSEAMIESGKFGNKNYNGNLIEEDDNTYYQLEDGTKINFLDKKEYKKMIDEFYDSLTEKEKTALYNWVSDPHWMGEKNDKIMDEIFEKKAVVLDKDVLLFRRASDDYLDLKNGVSSKYALSTSAYNKVPKTMPSGVKFGEKELYIIAPKGTKILPIEKVAVNNPYNDEGDKKIYTRQHEIILPKKSNYEMVEDLSNYYYRSPKGNERYDVQMSEHKYVVKLTNKKYKKVDYGKPKYKMYWSYNGYEKYVYKYKGNEIEIKEVYVGDRDGRYEKKKRGDVIKYEVFDLERIGQDRYYDTYEDVIERIKKYL